MSFDELGVTSVAGLALRSRGGRRLIARQGLSPRPVRGAPEHRSAVLCALLSWPQVTIYLPPKVMGGRGGRAWARRAGVDGAAVLS